MWHWLRTSCTTSKTKCTHSVFEGCMYPRKGEGNRRLKGWAGAVRWGERQASSFCSTGRKDGHRWGLSLFPSHNWHQAWFGHSWQLQACPLAQEGKIGTRPWVFYCQQGYHCPVQFPASVKAYFDVHHRSNQYTNTCTLTGWPLLLGQGLVHQGGPA